MNYMEDDLADDISDYNIHVVPRLECVQTCLQVFKNGDLSAAKIAIQHMIRENVYSRSEVALTVEMIESLIQHTKNDQEMYFAALKMLSAVYIPLTDIHLRNSIQNLIKNRPHVISAYKYVYEMGPWYSRDVYHNYTYSSSMNLGLFKEVEQQLDTYSIDQLVDLGMQTRHYANPHLKRDSIFTNIRGSVVAAYMKLTGKMPRW
jgi:hypothetical protein